MEGVSAGGSGGLRAFRQTGRLHWFSLRFAGWTILVAGLCLAKVVLFPGYPSTWNRIRDTPGISVAEAERILSESGAAPDLGAGSGQSYSESYSLPQPFGTWSVTVYGQNDSEQLFGAEADFHSSLIPWLQRTRSHRLR